MGRSLASWKPPSMLSPRRCAWTHLMGCCPEVVLYVGAEAAKGLCARTGVLGWRQTPKKAKIPKKLLPLCSMANIITAWTMMITAASRAV